MLTWRAWTLFSPDKLKTEEDAKLGRILSKQRYHQNQLQTQPGPIRSDTNSPRSPRSLNTSGESARVSNSSQHLSPQDLSVSESIRSNPADRAPVTAWTSVQEETSFNSRTSSKSQPGAEELVVQEVTLDDFDARSSISLLDSESIYLPVDVNGSPSKRPMTAPGATTPGTTAFISALTSNNKRPSTGAVDTKESKYDSLESRPIRPINQGIAKGQMKPSFDFSPPQSSGTGPKTRVRRPTPPTAESQDYDTSIDTSNVSDHENMDEKVPIRELSLIKDKIGARKAQKNPPSIEERKAKLFNKRTEKSDSNKSNIPVPNNAVSSVNHRAAASKVASDSKSVKSRLNLEKFEESGRLKSTMGSSVRDSGFLSRPCSDAMLGDTTDIEQKAATVIQACWRGYAARELNPQVLSVRKEIRARRAEDHIVLLKAELEKYKHQSTEERKLRALQMEAIKTLWQEVQSLQNWKTEVLASQSIHSSNDSNSKHFLSVTASQRSSSSTERSDILERLSGDSTLRSAFSPVDVERQRDLEKTCASLQSQVSQLKEALDTISSAVFHSACFTLTQGQESGETGSLQVTGNFEQELNSIEAECTSCSGRWSSVPHSLSPYPSEEEESYFRQVPQEGVPTPPRALRLDHKGDNSVLLQWQSSNLSDRTGSILGYRVYVNDKCLALVSSSKTVALVSGLDTSTTYKFYVKALSGLGESYESNIIMAKLAKVQNEQRRLSESSDSDMPDDSDKDHDSTESHEKRRHRKRETRKTRKVKSPRSEKTKSNITKESDSRPDSKTTSPAPSDRPRITRTTSDAAPAILTSAKRHMHKRNKSGDYHKFHVSDGNIDSTKQETDGRVQSSPSDVLPVSSSSSPSSVSSSPTKSYPQQQVNLTPARPLHTDKPSSSADTTNMSGTFTVDQASSYLQTITANVVRDTIATSKAKLRESQEKEDSVRSHRRKRSNEFKMSEMSDRRSVGSGDADSVTELDGDSVVHRQADRKEAEKRLSDGTSDDSLLETKVKGHRRKRSKDLQNQVSEWKKDDEVFKKADSSSVGKDGDCGSQNRPIIDGRKRHSSGSRPSSPMLGEQGEKDVVEKRRTPMAETLEQRLLNMSSKSSSMGSLSKGNAEPRHRQLPDPNIVLEESGIRKRTASLGSEKDLPGGSKTDQKSFASKLLHKLQTFSKSQEKIREKSRRKSSGSSRDSKPPSDDEGRRPRRISDSDHEASSDTSLLQRRPGDSSSGSHSDDSRSTRPRKTHRRTPSDGKLMPPVTAGLDGERPTHSPIIMEGAMIKKGSSGNVRRHASFHGLLPSKQDKHGAQASEDGETQKLDQGSIAMPTD